MYTTPNEYEPLRGSTANPQQKQAYMIGGGAALIVFCLFAFSGSSETAALAQQNAELRAQLNQATMAVPAVPAAAAVQAAVEVPAVADATAAQQPAVQQAVMTQTAVSTPGFELSVAQYDGIYNIFSFAIACMGSATVFFFFQFSLVSTKFRTPLVITGLVTLIAFYHYIRIFNSFCYAYVSKDGTVTSTGIPFNDAYRYVDWLLTVPLLLTEIILVMKLSPEETRDKIVKLGCSSAVMIILGYPGEISDDAKTRWLFWGLAMIPFIFIVYTLVIGLSGSIQKNDPQAQPFITAACYITAISWCTYPIVFMFPMLGLDGADADTAVQVGYSIADVIAKPITGLLVWKIAKVRDEIEN